ncbi:MAG: HU family DNA-binding protein [Candidatus Neomarinimicrobiota bacterium]|jgi:nucleoid DNA-binding protein|nr:HU family DNA-binding protein [Candidatus Neomarinimicrobiota bacterium]|tara:strand:+ start:122 stop:436 length:315 start_codon:yes stop_codon:yes gene_type:complete
MKISYKREDVIRRTASKLDLENKEVKIILDKIIDTITDMFLENHSNIRLEIRNFGTFEVKPASAKPNARNPKTNEVIYVPPHKKIHFRPGKIIKNELSKEYILK